MAENNNTTSTKEPRSTVSPIAIAGFAFMLLVIAWLSVQLISVLPSAFSSLASLAEGVNQYQNNDEASESDESFVVSTNTDLVNAGATVDLTWTPIDKPGNFTFSYQCTDGVAISLLDANGSTPINCGDSYNIGNNESVTLAVESEKNRFAAIPYTVAFFGTNDQSARHTAAGEFTVINSTIAETTTDTESTDTTPVEPAPEPETEITETAPINPPTTPEPEITYSYNYEIPVSDPNGFTDLGVTFGDTGTIVVDTFFPGELVQDESGAVQFVVRNYGTRTSDSWSYTITLPNGDTYRDSNQAPLKPNEAATITIGFPVDTSATHEFVINVATSRDTASINNTVRENVIIY